jgi:hypothetical protein
VIIVPMMITLRRAIPRPGTDSVGPLLADFCTHPFSAWVMTVEPGRHGSAVMRSPAATAELAALRCGHVV